MEVFLLRASTVPVSEYLDELKEIDTSHIYTNYINQRFEETIMSSFFKTGSCYNSSKRNVRVNGGYSTKRKKKGKYALMPLHSCDCLSRYLVCFVQAESAEKCRESAEACYLFKSRF